MPKGKSTSTATAAFCFGCDCYTLPCLRISPSSCAREFFILLCILVELSLTCVFLIYSREDPCASVVKKREVLLRCLIEYMGESGNELISDYQGKEEVGVQQDLKMESMKIYVCREPDAVGIIIEGVPVLTNVGNVARACCLLLGLAYALNLEYPPKLGKTFEVFQRLLVKLDTLAPKPTSRFTTLKNRLMT